MTAARCSEEEFISLFRSMGATKLARHLGTTPRRVFERRRSIEKARGISIVVPETGEGSFGRSIEHPQRTKIEIMNGTVLIGSDAHIWPGEASTAIRAFTAFCKEFRPKAVILNGDVLDFATVSRHPPIGWEKRPTVQEEIEAGKDRLHEIELAAGRGVRKIWTLGNHDARFESRLAAVAPEYARVAGIHLRDHFPHWEPCWSSWINENVVVKHRFKGGIHAPHNNTMWAGKTIITGHLHSAKVIPFSDYTGTRYGVDTGCLADPDGPQFVDYTEDNPKNWRSGFCVLTFVSGRLLQPELALVFDGNKVEFRGKVIAV